MEGVVGGLATKGLVYLFDQFGTWTYDWIFKGISKFAEAVLELTTTATSVFWDVAAIEAFLNFSAWVNVMVLVVSLLFLAMDIAEQSGRVNWAIVASNFFKGIIFVYFNRYIGMVTYQITEQLTTSLNIQMSAPHSLIASLLSTDITSGIFLILIVLVILAAFVAFFIMAMLRNGTLFVQILSSSFYIPAIVRGDTAKLGDWLRQTVAISATYAIQYILFYLGLSFLTGLTGGDLVLTGTCWTTMFFVPKILEQFGYSSGASSVLSAAGNTASAGLSFAKGGM